MPYVYKNYTLPTHKDRDWHVYVDPFFRSLIDNDERYTNDLKEYTIELFEENLNVMYSLRTNGDWKIYRVTESNNTYLREIASQANNNNIDKTTAWNNKTTLMYEIV